MSTADAVRKSASVGAGAAELRARGCVRFDAGNHIDDIDLPEAHAELEAQFESLPQDPYARSLNRFRRYASGVLVPWMRHIDWPPAVEDDRGRKFNEYYQGDHNPDYPGVARSFETISGECRRNPMLERLIWIDFGHTFWRPAEMRRPLAVGIHLVKLLAERDGEIAISSPNHLHQDGEPFTFVHLVRRDNAVGAVNTVARPDCSGLLPDHIADDFILDTFELTQPLESYGVCDRMVSHYVSPLTRGPEPRPGLRCSLLIDFTPMVPRI